MISLINLYKKWNLTNKVMFWIAVLGIIIGLVFGGTHIINVNSGNENINIQNSTLIKSPIVQDSNNVTITFSERDDSLSPHYTQEIFVRKAILIDNTKYNVFDILFILPDNQKALLLEAEYNKSYGVAGCNNAMSDCYVYHKYRTTEEINYSNICLIIETRLGHTEMGSDHESIGEKFIKSQDDCLRKVIN